MIDYFSLFRGVPPELAVILVSMIPIAELRVGLPLALAAYQLPWSEAVILSVLGNMIPIFFILKLIGPVSGWLSKNFKIFEKFFTWLFGRTRSKIVRQYEKYGLWALAIFVAIPLPMTGAWTGALAAWLFGVDFKKSLFFIFLGVIGASAIVFLATTGTVGFFKLFF